MQIILQILITNSNSADLFRFVWYTALYTFYGEMNTLFFWIYAKRTNLQQLFNNLQNLIWPIVLYINQSGIDLLCPNLDSELTKSLPFLRYPLKTIFRGLFLAKSPVKMSFSHTTDADDDIGDNNDWWQMMMAIMMIMMMVMMVMHTSLIPPIKNRNNHFGRPCHMSSGTC